MKYDYDLFVIGGGSGGVRAARMAALAGARVALAEEYRMGGTCVIRGCIPKKLLVYASQFSENIMDAAGYGWAFGDCQIRLADPDRQQGQGDRPAGRALHQECEGGRRHHLPDRAVFEDPHTLRLVNSGKTVTAEKILIATGNRPTREMGTSSCHSRRRALHHLRRGFPPEGTAQAHPDRRRRLYRAGIRPYLSRAGQPCVPGLSRRKAAARLRQ